MRRRFPERIDINDACNNKRDLAGGHVGCVSSERMLEIGANIKPNQVLALSQEFYAAVGQEPGRVLGARMSW